MDNMDRMDMATMSKLNNHRPGFSLIEVIVSLVLLAILGLTAGLGVVEMARGYVFSREVGEATRMTEAAFARLTVELERMDQVTAATSTQITYRRWSGAAFQTSTIAYLADSKTVTLSVGGGAAQPVMKKVGAFTGGDTFLAYEKTDGTAWIAGDDLATLYKVVVRIPYDFSIGETSIFATEINPRNSGAPNFPLPRAS
jgi:prepilin-type N-terminal cleavage/methylation domain-containing protein